MAKEKHQNIVYIFLELNFNEKFLIFVVSIYLASLKNLGDKAGNLFHSKKKEATDLANQKVQDAQHIAEEQATKVGESLSKTKDDVTNLATSTATEGMFAVLKRLFH